MSDNRVIGKNTIRAQVKNYIQTQIQNGIYKPGDRIPETGLAKELNISQAPVREAMLELSAMGLLEERPYYGTFVRRLTAEDIEDIYNTRAFIEEYATKRAAKLMTDEEFQEFQPIFNELEIAVEHNNLEEFNEADVKFHRHILAGAKSKALTRIWETLQLGSWTSITLQATERSLRDLLEEHETIYRYLITRADYSAGSAMFLHIKNFTDDLVSYMANNNLSSEKEKEI